MHRMLLVLRRCVCVCVCVCATRIECYCLTRQNEQHHLVKHKPHTHTHTHIHTYTHTHTHTHTPLQNQCWGRWDREGDTSRALLSPSCNCFAVCDTRATLNKKKRPKATKRKKENWLVPEICQVSRYEKRVLPNSCQMRTRNTNEN
jgi:hypothetical protein